MGNLIAHRNLSEIFLLEQLRGLQSALNNQEAATIMPVLNIVLAFMITAVFFVLAVFLAAWYREYRAGYRGRSILAVGSAIMVVFISVFISFATLPTVAKDSSFTENANNDRFILGTFMNRQAFMQRFGTPLFYTINLMEIMNIRPSFGISASRAGGGMTDFPMLPFELSEDYNLIMIMMETLEKDAIHPLVMPNLWDLKGISTSVDGYYAFERTCMTEWTSLVGSHLMGQEMWNSFPRANAPMSLPNIFRRKGYDQLGSFHNWWRDMYDRDVVLPEGIGFDFFRVPHDYGQGIYGRTTLNSDYHMFRWMIDDIAPSDRTFMNYVLNVTTHHPIYLHIDHDGAGSFIINHPRFAQYFTPDFDAIMAVRHLLPTYFPKLITGTLFEQRAVMQYLMNAHNLDRGIGVLLDHLKSTPDLARHPCGTVMLIETTALVLYADHFNFSWYNHHENTGGGRLSHTNINQTLGERLPFIIFNPRDTEALSGGRVIERFMSNSDIFPTVMHLFGMNVSKDITLGVSIFDESSFSVGIGFVTYGVAFFGLCLDTGLPWVTRDMVNFTDGSRPNTVHGHAPSHETVQRAIVQIDLYGQTMYRLRRHFNDGRFPEYAYYSR